ncbi:hypothetical protein PCANC_21698 [Puccinia coronata f. sp. avenae]|uniref:Uncharacterized protein n=1 Tax=Puccinia coronata f. sp. avenae TaxID=200324 RepID=A0A2N5U9G2_9BASI|nr:hypothetical protein PCANC_21698 [Puccinia coronata f. sp. avenae]
MIPGLPPPNSHPIHPGQPHSDRPLIQDPTQHSERIEANPVYSSSASVDQDKPNKSRSNLWAPNPVRPTVRVSVPTIVPPALSPIALRRSSYFKSNNNGKSEYLQTSSDGGQGTSLQLGTGPEPIGHPTSSQPRPQTIPMPPRYAPGLVSPALPKTIQMTPSMPAFHARHPTAPAQLFLARYRAPAHPALRPRREQPYAAALSSQAPGIGGYFSGSPSQSQANWPAPSAARPEATYGGYLLPAVAANGFLATQHRANGGGLQATTTTRTAHCRTVPPANKARPGWAPCCPPPPWLRPIVAWVAMRAAAPRPAAARASPP